MTIGVLGALSVVRDGAVVPVEAPTQRRALIYLAVHVDEVVSVDQLADAVWHRSPPDDVAHAVHSLVYRIRRAFGEGDDAVRRIEPGYQLMVRREAIDACVFTDRTLAARRIAADHPAVAREMLIDALALWRGDALLDVAYEPWAASEVRRLTEMRLTACETLADLNIALGDADLAIAELSSLTERFPLRETLWVLLWRALAASGRHVDVIASHRRARELLGELDVVPSPQLETVASTLAHQAVG